MNVDFFKKHILRNQFIRGSFSTVCAKFGSLDWVKYMHRQSLEKKGGKKDFVFYEVTRSASKL